MKCNEFSDLVDKVAEENGFKCEFILIMANEKGKLDSFTHVWNDNIKPCRLIRILSKIFRISCKDFKNLY